MSAYAEWKAAQTGRKQICDEPSDYCTRWVVEHVEAWLRGEYVSYAWRQALASLVGMVPHREYD